MSGQRNKKPSDVIKIRQEYLDNLSLEVQLNEANEQAVKQFVSTGQVPPISQMKDNRTTSQILLDVEKLKINLIKDLEPIANPQFAQQIISRLVQSPLNQDNRLIIFAAQRIDDIVKNLKKNYKYGIKGDANDAEQFVMFINKFYTDKNKTTEGTKSFINRMGSNTEAGATSMINKQHSILTTVASEFNVWYDENLRITRELYALRDNAGNRVYANPQPSLVRLNNINITDIKTKLRGLIQILPITITSIQRMEQMSIQNEGTTTYNAINDNYNKFLNFINHNIPNTDYVETIITDLRDINKELTQLLRYISQQGYLTIYNKQVDSLERLNSILDVDMGDLADIEADARKAKELIDTTPYEPETMQQGVMTPQQVAEYRDLMRKINNNIGLMAANAGAPLAHAAPGIAPVPLNAAPFAAKVVPYAVAPGRYNVKDLPNLEALRRETFDHLAKYNIVGQGVKMSGRGLTRPDYTQGIEPSARYIKFGRYMINNKKLNDNVLSLRRSKGSTIASIPATKMTSELGNVIKKIVGGGVPSYDELNKLTDAEKKYLYKVSNEADIYDKIKIPTPCKDEEEKDIHLFNVMKGEIMAGNNSKELISKFKNLLNKLSRTNVLPKSQVREILEELLELGF